MEKEWNNDELIKYMRNFKEGQQENIIKQLFESDVLERFLATTNGRLIITDVVTSIAEDTMAIVRSAIKGDLDEVQRTAMRIDVAYKFIYRLAQIAESGEAHKKGMKGDKNG